MAETADDLSTPLGQKTVRRKRRFRLPFTGIQALAVLLGLFLVTFVGFAIFNDNPLGGEPVARIALRQAAPAAEKPAAAPSNAAEHGAKSAPKQAAAGEQKTVTIIDGSSGARHDVVIGGDAADKVDPAAAPAMMASIDPRLLEKSRYGMIPVVSDGLKPFTVYAAEADRAKAAKMPVVSIVVGGLGVGAAKTTDAIMKLPAAVTLAFTPYGSDPGKLAERARALGQFARIGAVGRERQRHRGGQFHDGVGGLRRADAKPADHDGNHRHFRRLGAVGLGGVDREGFQPVGYDRDHAVTRFFQQAGIDTGHDSGRGVGPGLVGLVAGVAADHHVMVRAARAVDDGDGLSFARGGLFGRGFGAVLGGAGSRGQT